MDERELWRELGQQLRVDAVRASAKAGSGHPTSSMSAADLAAVLLAGHLRYDFDAPHDPRNDRLVFSKGHASPLVYGLFRAAGALSEEEFGTYRQLGSRLEGHPGARPPLGRRRDGLARPGPADRRRDGDRRQEAQPPPVPRLGHLRRQRDGRGVDVGGGGARGLLRARQPHRDRRRQPARPAWRDDARLGPLLVLAPARGVRLARDRDRRPRRRGDRRRLPRGRVDVRTADGDRRANGEGQGVLEGRERERLARQGGRRGGGRGARRRPQPPRSTSRSRSPGARTASRRRPRRGRRTRSAARSRPARRTARRWRRSAPRTAQVVALDGEVSNSTFAEIFRDAHPERFVEMYIAEQQMVAAAVGMQVLGWKPFSSTFAAFLSRAYDFVRMAAVSRATLRLCGSHAGVSIGEDGPSQMGLEDLAEFRAIHGSTVLYPCDGNQTTALVRTMGELDGISYLRTTRGDTPVVYGGGRGVPGRRLEDAPRGRRRRDRRGRHHRARGAARGGDARRGGHLRARGRLLLRQADRRRDPERAPHADRDGRGPLGRGRPRARRCSPPSRRAAPRPASSSSPCASCRTPASRPSSSQRRASTPSTSPRQHARSSASARASRSAASRGRRRGRSDGDGVGRAQALVGEAASGRRRPASRG